MMARLLQRPSARTAFRRGTSMLHPECPVEQSIRSDDAAVQAALLQAIWRRHSFIEQGALLVAEPKGLRVLARTEGALRGPVDALSRQYGRALIVEPPSVRYAHGAPVLEPYMTVLLCGPARYQPRLQGDLVQRRAQLTRVDQRADPFVLEAEAPLGSLLGYREWLDDWSGGDIDVSMWLSRYRADRRRTGRGVTRNGSLSRRAASRSPTAREYAPGQMVVSPHRILFRVGHHG